MYTMIHSDNQYQQTKSWVEHCLDILIYNTWSSSKHVSHYKHYPIVDDVWGLRDVTQSKHICTTVITPYTHHVIFGVRETVVINSTLHHPSHGGKYKNNNNVTWQCVTVGVTQPPSGNTPPGHTTRVFKCRRLVLSASVCFCFYLSSVNDTKASD